MSLELVPHFRDLQSLDLRLSDTYLESQLPQDLGKLDNLLEMTLDASHHRQASIEATISLTKSDTSFYQLHFPTTEKTSHPWDSQLNKSGSQRHACSNESDYTSNS